MTPDRPRTLVVHSGGIGDFLLALPAIATFQNDGPLELAGHRDRVELAVAGGIATAAHSLDAIGFHTVFDSPSARLRACLGRFDRVIVFMRDPGGAIRRGVVACGVARAEVFDGLPDAAGSGHAAEYYASCLRAAPAASFRLAIPPQGPPLDVVVHPGSGSPKKNWPMNHFRELAQRLAQSGRRIAWCVGPAEVERGMAPEPGDDVLRGTSLVELASRIATARAYVGNDSGITHLAAALGIPTVAIFGPTDPAVWAPRGNHVHVVRGDPWPDTDAVLANLSS